LSAQSEVRDNETSSPTRDACATQIPPQQFANLVHALSAAILFVT
jgi:hypothetical protein